MEKLKRVGPPFEGVGGVKVQLHALLFSTLDRFCRLRAFASLSRVKMPFCTHWKGVWVDCRGGLDVVVSRQLAVCACNQSVVRKIYFVSVWFEHKHYFTWSLKKLNRFYGHDAMCWSAQRLLEGEGQVRILFRPCVVWLSAVNLLHVR
jgi:hypothetical protein